MTWRFLVPKFFAVTLTLIVVAAPRAALAETDASSRALAVQLFDEAEALLAKGQVAEACPKYAESFRLDPQLGALIYLAECYEKNGQTASAWGAYREAEEMAQKRADPRGAQAHSQAAALEARLDYLALQVPASARVPGLEVLRDGAPVAAVLWGSPAACDPGKHRIEARAPGYLPFVREIDVPAGSKRVAFEIPKLTADPHADGAGAKPGRSGTTRRIGALAVGGLGIVGIGVGGFLGLSAQASLSDSKSLCNERDYCTARGDELRDSARTKALGATIATGVGVAALTTAAVLWFTGRDSESVDSAKSQRWLVAPKSSAWGVDVARSF
jgi:hypothetical protein